MNSTSVVPAAESPSSKVTPAISNGVGNTTLIATKNRVSWVDRSLVLVGCVYIVCSLLATVIFFLNIKESIKTDYWWPGYNPSTTGIYTAQALNTILNFHENYSSEAVSFDLTDSLFTLHSSKLSLTLKDNAVLYNPAYKRAVQHLDGFPIATSIQDIRTLKGYNFMYNTNAYCWVDFDRRWYIAHSLERQKRCENKKENGAYYLEALLRNTNVQKIPLAYRSTLNISIYTHILKQKGGNEWLHSTLASQNLTIEEEEAYWRQKGIKEFVIPWQNVFNTGFTEKVNIKNAFGLNHQITIKSDSYASQYTSLNSHRMYWSFINDQWAIIEGNTAIAGMSYVHGSSNYAFRNTNPMEILIKDAMLPKPLTFQNKLWIKYIGNYGTIDIRLERMPLSLSSFYKKSISQLSTIIYENLDAQTDFKQFYKTNGHVMEPFPSNWKKNATLYFGGSPICFNLKGQNHPHRMLTYTSSCRKSVRFAFNASTYDLMIAAIVFDEWNMSSKTNVQKICSVFSNSNLSCEEYLQQIVSFIRKYMSVAQIVEIRRLARIAMYDLLIKNIVLMQYAKIGGIPFLLKQQILTKNNTVWNFVGWTLVSSWAARKAEVLTFEGDVGNITVISSPVPQIRLEKISKVNPKRLSVLVLCGQQYATVVLLLVAAMMLFYIIVNRGNANWLNFFSFNQIVGVVWIGRPLLALRAVLAMSVLSSGRLRVIQNGEFLKLDDSPRNFLLTIILGGETSWISYVISDVFCFLTRGYTKQYSLLSIFLGWFFTVLIEVINPVSVTSTIKRVCNNGNGQGNILLRDLTCISGTVSVGSPSRLAFLFTLHIACMIVSYTLIRLTTKPNTFPRGGELILPGIACEQLSSEGWVFKERWHLDKASCVMCGLISLRFRSSRRLLDIKSWTFLYLNGTHVSSVVKAKNPMKYLQNSKFLGTVKLSILNIEKNKQKRKNKIAKTS